jgi:demethylmenaquinone methyltransferase/2-methoxy-6-polyprenyl-1,4-benzoquinol methylase
MNAGAEVARGGSGAMFDAIASRYDLLNRIISLGIDASWRRKAVAKLGLDGPSRVLDVATGTADLAIETTRMLPESIVTGVDPSTGMLDVGRRKIARLSLEGRVSLAEGEAEALPFDDATFDGVTIAFGIRNVADRPRGLAEMRRVVKPGGRVVVLELSEPERGIMSSLAKLHIHGVVPAVGGLLSGRREYAYLQASIAAFPPPDAFADLMRGSGLDVVDVVKLTFGVAHIFVGQRPVVER